jgi:hypothetical protein
MKFGHGYRYMSKHSLTLMSLRHSGLQYNLLGVEREKAKLVRESVSADYCQWDRFIPNLRTDLPK